MNIVAENLILPPHIVKEAKQIYEDNKQTLNYGSPHLKITRVNILEVASLYLACRLNRVPRTLNDFSYGANVDRKLLSRTYRDLLKTNRYHPPVVDPLIFLNRVVSRLDLSPATINWVQKQLTQKAEICSLVGRDPMTRLASMLYVGCVVNGDDQTQENIANVCQITSISIRNGYKKLRKAGIGC